MESITRSEAFNFLNRKGFPDLELGRLKGKEYFIIKNMHGNYESIIEEEFIGCQVFSLSETVSVTFNSFIRETDDFLPLFRSTEFKETFLTSAIAFYNEETGDEFIILTELSNSYKEGLI